LESLYQISYPNYDVILVDNGSEDDSIAKTKEWAKGELKVESKFFEYDFHNKPIEILEYKRAKAEEGGNFQKEERLSKFPSNKKLRIIKNEKNYGFAEGNNIGMRYALKVLNPNYVLLLNNDTVVDPDFLTELVKVAKSDRKIGALQPKILRKNNIDIIDSVGQEIFCDGRMRDIWFGKADDGRFDTIHEIFGACAAAALYKGSALESAELFDKNFFAIFEDVDLSWRIGLAGYKALLAPKAIVYHKRGVSGKTHYVKTISAIKSYYTGKNRLCILVKYYPPIFIFKYSPILLYVLFKVLFYSSKIKDKDKGLIRELFECIKERRSIQIVQFDTHSLIKGLQEKWIIRELTIKVYFSYIKELLS